MKPFDTQVKEMLHSTHIILHHSLTRDGQTVSWNAIRKYHTRDLGWRDIGYHFGIELVGDHYEILLGRQLDETGAHCRQKNMNRKSFGICLVGNFDDHKIPEAQWNLALKLVRSLMHVFTISLENIKGHCEYANYKTCPGKNFSLTAFRSLLRSMP